MTIVELFRKLNETLTEYKIGVLGSAEAVEKIEELNTEASVHRLPFRVDITAEDLRETGISSTYESSWGAS